MSRWKELKDFEERFPEKMGVEELRRWKIFFTKHAEHLQPKIRKLAMKRVHAIDNAVALKEMESS